MKSLFILCVFLICFSASSHALSCQYTEQTISQKDVQNVYLNETNEFVTNTIVIGDFIIDSIYGNFKVYNDYNYPLTVRVYFKYTVSNQAGYHVSEFDQLVNVSRRDYTKVDFSSGHSLLKSIDQNSIVYSFVDNWVTYTKYEKVNETVCKQCLGKNCSDDGLNCSTNAECGGGFCILNICNNQPACYNADCKCEQNEAQCPDNARCVQTGVLDVGIKPICTEFECKGYYVDPATSLCARRTGILINGEQCSINDDCVGKYCIKGYCNDNPSCYNNDCNCQANETQCPDNSKCVQKSALELGDRPICTARECKSAYMNTTTGLCVKTPEEVRAEEEKLRQEIQAQEELARKEAEKAKQEENLRNIVIGIILFIIGIASLLSYFKVKNDAEIKRKDADIRTKSVENDAKLELIKMQKDAENERLRVEKEAENKRNDAEIEVSAKSMEFDLKRLQIEKNAEVNVEQEKTKQRGQDIEKLKLELSKLDIEINKKNKVLEKNKKDLEELRLTNYQTNEEKAQQKANIVKITKEIKEENKNMGQEIEEAKEKRRELEQELKSNDEFEKEKKERHQRSVTDQENYVESRIKFYENKYAPNKFECYNGYLRFKRSMQSSNTPGKLLHIWVARLELFMHYESFYKHEEMFNGLTRDNFYELGGKYNVHHINGNKFDNEVDNLIILPRTMHDAIHRTYTILGREIGIRALMDIKAKAPHIPELAD